MSLDKKTEKKGKITSAGQKKGKGVEKSPAGLVAEIAESSVSLSDVSRRLSAEHNIDVTIPTVSAYLRQAWGKDYAKKKKEMAERRSRQRSWRQEFELSRQNVGEMFKLPYLGTDDGVYANYEKGEVESLPSIKDRAYRRKNIINFTKEADFGWEMNPKDPDAEGKVDSSVAGVVIRQLNRRIAGLTAEKKDSIKKKAFDKKLSEVDIEKYSSEDIPGLFRKIGAQVSKEVAPSLVEVDKDAERTMSSLLAQIYEGDGRTSLLHKEKVIDKKLCPAYASSDKKQRGKQRMLTIPSKTFSRAVYNLPFPLYMHPKRLQVHSHNLAKKLPELLHSEVPVVKAEYNDIPGINARVRFPKSSQEFVETQEAGMIISEALAKKFRYFTVVEEGSMIAENSQGLPSAPRINKSIVTYADYKRATSSIKGTYPIDRLDPLTLGGFEEVGFNVGNKFAKHSGELFLLGPPRKRRRKITLAQSEKGDKVVDVEYLSQDYQIVREDDLRVGDKLLDRGGLKGIISAIKSDLGKDAKGRPYELICNPDEVWRDSDRSTLEGRILDDTRFKQGKKKSAILLEHEKSDGQIFFFIIDKFAQDQITTGLNFSSTMLSGLWERALATLPGNATDEDRDNLIDNFASHYFRGEGNLIPTLKALHYKAVKKNGIVTIEVDEREPTPDEKGEIIFLPHTFAGNSYKYAYVPHSIARVYFDGKTFREVYIEQQDSTPSDYSEFYWFNIMRQAKNRFGLFPKMDWGIQLVTRPWCEDPKDLTKSQYVEMNYMDIIDMGGDPYDPHLKVTIRKEPVTSKNSIQTHPVKVDWTGPDSLECKRSTIGLNPTIAAKATIDYDGDTVVAFIPAIEPAITEMSADDKKEVRAFHDKFGMKFEDYYKKAHNTKYAEDEKSLGVQAARYNQEIAETESELIERLGGLRKRSMILQGKNPPPIATIGRGTRYEKQIPLTIEKINSITDVEKILKMREPRWLIKQLQKKKWEDLTPVERDIVEDYHVRNELSRYVNAAIKDKSVKKLYDLLREPSDYIKEEFMSKASTEDPIQMKLDTKNRLLDRILYNEIKESDVYVDLDKS